MRISKHIAKHKKKYIAAVLAVASTATIALHQAPAPIVNPTPIPENPIVNQHPMGNRAGPDFLYQNDTLTPGATNPNITQDNISQNICAGASWSTKSIRPPVSYTNALKIKELNSGYNLNGDTNPADYELDHLISLEIGGNPTSELNLWNEPYHTQVGGIEIGAHQKDTVENTLHKEVCAGTITLQKAQEIIVQDWYACYLNIQGHNDCI